MGDAKSTNLISSEERRRKVHEANKKKEEVKMAKKKEGDSPIEGKDLHALISESVKAADNDSNRFFFEAHNSTVEVMGTVDVSIVSKTSDMDRVVKILEFYGIKQFEKGARPRPAGTRGELSSIVVNGDLLHTVANFLIRPLSVIPKITCEIPPGNSNLSIKGYLDWGEFWIGRTGSNILRQGAFYALWNLIALQNGNSSCTDDGTDVQPSPPVCPVASVQTEEVGRTIAEEPHSKESPGSNSVGVCDATAQVEATNEVTDGK